MKFLKGCVAFVLAALLITIIVGAALGIAAAAAAISYTVGIALLMIVGIFLVADWIQDLLATRRRRRQTREMKRPYRPS